MLFEYEGLHKNLTLPEKGWKLSLKRRFLLKKAPFFGFVF
jgi:hypothetical protein